MAANLEAGSKDEPTAEDKLRRSVIFLQSLVDAIPIPVFYKDTQGIYLGCNTAFEDYIGLKKDQIIGKSVYDVSPKEYADIYRKMDDALLREKKPQSYETKVKYGNGTPHDVRFYKAPFYNPDGSTGGLIGVIFDISEQKRTGVELQKSREELEERVMERTNELIRVNESLKKEIEERKRTEKSLSSEKSRAELYVDLMGHDINNMNQVALGYIELAMDRLENKGGLDDELRALLERPLEALRMNSRLIDNVKKLQKEKAGGYEPKVIEVGKVIEDVIARYRSVPGRDITINYEPGTRCRTRANDLLQDVFSNIVGNAIKHSAGPLTITITLEPVHEPEGDYCRAAIEDNGPGIPDNLKKKLFDRLCLLRARAGGKGFGLCLIKMLMDDFDGKFWVEDRVTGNYAQGCRFVVMLPLAGDGPG